MSETLDEAVARTGAYMEATREDFAARGKKAQSSLSPGGKPSVLAGPVATTEDQMWLQYTSDHYLYETPVFLPYMMMHLPREHRWAYSKRFEVNIMELVLRSVGGKIIGVTDGHAPGYDLIAETDEGVHKFEIKSTAKHKIFIEGGRYDMTQSGLSLTESEIYLVVSRDDIQQPDGTFKYKGKVRICFTYLLVQEYMRLAQHSESAFQPDRHGPGSRGVKMDIKKDDIPHVWIGDIACAVDEYGNTMYDTSAFITQPAEPNRARREFNKGVRLMEKHDTRLEELE